MTLRKILVVSAAALIAAGCSKGMDRSTSVMPTSPSAITLPESGGGVSHRTVVGFPARTDTLDFRVQLESKYANQLRRPASQVYVDMDGEVAWIQEYVRYRVNGCDHDTATQYALAQVDGGVAAPVCAIRFFPESAIYPPRNETVDFRHQLGNKYQAMGRSAQSSVDPDGAAIWIAEYLRYRTSGCDHTTAVQNTLTQVDGNPAPATCVTQCAYYISPATVSATPVGGTFTVTLMRTSGSCEWIATSDAAWVTFTPPITGGDRSPLTLVVAPNTGDPRSATVRISYAGGASFFEVKQAAITHNLVFALVDPATSATNPTTECLIRTTSTICTLQALTAALPSPVASYDWKVEYTYNGTKVKTQVGPLPTYSFTESCAGSASGGSIVPLVVTLKATDTAGRSATIVSGQGAQPALQLKTSPCP